MRNLHRAGFFSTGKARIYRDENCTHGLSTNKSILASSVLRCYKNIAKIDKDLHYSRCLEEQRTWTEANLAWEVNVFE